MSDTEIVPVEELRLGSLQVTGPAEVITRATEVAKQLAKVVKDRRLSRTIGNKEYVYVEGWTTLGAMLGITPREVSVVENADGDYTAEVELIRVVDGQVIGRGSALCGADEPTWGKRPRYARRSMAITRAAGKAFRLSLSWIMTLAGYAPTPAEEMPEEPEFHTQGGNGHTEQAAEMDYETASKMLDSKGNAYVGKPTDELLHIANNAKAPEDKRQAAAAIMRYRSAQPEK